MKSNIAKVTGIQIEVHFSAQSSTLQHQKTQKKNMRARKHGEFESKLARN
jgi:hypothetical protein